MEKNKSKIYKHKISFVEALVVGPLFFVIPDIIEIVLIFFALDDFGIIDIYCLLTAQFYLYMKRVKIIYSLITSCLELIPYIGWLPLRTIGFLITISMDRLAEKISRAKYSKKFNI